MAELDRGAKIVLQSFPEDLLRLAFPDVEPGEPLGTEAVTAQVVSDRTFAGRGPDGDVLLHLEFEAEPTSDVGYRVARAACGLYFTLGLPVRTTVVYLHPAADGRRPKRSFLLPVGTGHVAMEFNILVLWEDLRVEALLADPRPGVLPFVGLAQGADLQHVRHAVRLLEALPVPEHQRADLRVALFLLSGYHFTSKELLAIMSEETLMQSKTYLWTLERGREEGRRALLAELLRARLGPVEGLEPRLASASPEAIASLTELVASGDSKDVLRLEVDRLLGPPRSEP